MIAALAGTCFWLSRQSDEPTIEMLVAQVGLTETETSPASKHSSLARPAEVGPASAEVASRDTAQRNKPVSAFARRRAIYDAASRTDERHLQALIGEARALTDPIDRIVTLDILLLRLLEEDPQAAVAIALESDRADAPHLLATLASQSPEQVWAALMHVGDPLARLQYQNAVASAWAIDDPERAFASIADLPEHWTRDQLMRQVTWSIARTEPQLAIELASTRPAHEKHELLEALADQWSRQDPAAAAQWIEGLGIDLQGRLAYRVAGAFVAQQREEALAWALRISRSPGKNLWSYMIGQIATTDPHDALTRALAVKNPHQRRQSLSQALTAIAARDASLAMSYIDKLPAGENRERAVAQVASQIALSQPSTAVEWLRDIAEPQTRMVAASAMASRLAYSNLESAAQLVDRVPDDVKAIWVQQVADAYAQADIERGIQWIDKHSDIVPTLREQFVQSVAMHAPDIAFDVADRYEDGLSDQFLVQLIGTVARQSPETAARELTRLSHDGARAQAAGAVASLWAQYDRNGSRKWVLSLESGVVRDTALSQFIPSAGSLEDSLDLIDRVQSSDLRMNAILHTATRLANTDPEGMNTLLRRHPLDPQRQQQLDTLISRSR
jgi:hypothetical protein